MSSLKYFGIPIVSIGLANPKDDSALEVLEKLDLVHKVYKKIVLKNNVIIGMIMVNCIERAGVIFYLMKNAVNIKRIKNQLLSDQFGLATLPTGVQKKMMCGTLT
jgi:nitrite reductase (NADH) large subunit